MDPMGHQWVLLMIEIIKPYQTSTRQMSVIH
jgi:hypothetical protein